MKKKLFISSVQSEFAMERGLLAEYIRQDALLSRYFVPFLFEELPATDTCVQQAYLDEAAQTDVYLLLLGTRYGSIDNEGLSPTEHEYDTATAHHAYRIAMLKDVAIREEKEQRFANKVEQDVVRNRFGSYEELQSNVYAALVQYMLRHGILHQGPFDASIHPKAHISDLDPEKIRWFVGMAHEKRQFPMQYSEENIHRILQSLHLVDDADGVTNAALLLFAKDVQRWFISATVKCAQFYGTKKEKPILSQQLYGGSVFEVVDQTEDFTTILYRTPPQVTPQVTPQVIRLIQAMGQREYSRNELMELLNLEDRENFRLNYLQPALQSSLIVMTIPDKPKSSKQKYRKINRER